jgi:hypothetical protein
VELEAILAAFSRTKYILKPFLLFAINADNVFEVINVGGV